MNDVSSPVGLGDSGNSSGAVFLVLFSQSVISLHFLKTSTMNIFLVRQFEAIIAAVFVTYCWIKGE